MYIKVNISLTIIHNNLPEYSNTAGFFEHLPNPIEGYLSADYKRKYATNKPQTFSQSQIDNLLRKPTMGVGNGFNSNPVTTNQILNINDIVAQNRAKQQQQTNNILRKSPF